MYEKIKQCKNVAQASKLEVNGNTYSRGTWAKVLKSRGVVIPKKKGKSTVWTDQQVNTICDYIGENNNPTLSSILSYAIDTLHYPPIALPTLERYLDLKLITWKQTVIHPFSRNSPETKERRKEYATWLSRNSHKRIVYADGNYYYYYYFVFFLESGFNLWMKPLNSWAKVGSTPVVVGSSQPGINQSLCMGIEFHDGVICHKIISGAFNTATFCQFVKSLVNALNDSNNLVLVIDNARIHNEKEIEMILKDKCDVKFLSPYSPMFNPIENVFGTLKSKIRKMLVSEAYAKDIQISLNPTFLLFIVFSQSPLLHLGKRQD
jgi:transposase